MLLKKARSIPRRYGKVLIFLFSLLLIFPQPGFCPPANYPITLQKGQNFISLPLNPTDPFIQQAFYSIDGKYTNIWFYDNTDPDNVWKHYHPDYIGFSDLQNIYSGKGYWVEAISDCTLFVDGIPINTNFSLSLRQGWNSFGWPYLESQAIQNALYTLSFGTDYSRICRLNPQNKSFESYSGQFTTFDAGRAYYIYALRDCTVEILPLPYIKIIQPEPDSFHNTPDISVSGSVNQPNMTVKVNNVPAAVTNLDFSANITLNEGKNTIEVQGTNPAGNTASDSINVILDTNPPLPPLLNPVNSPTNKNKQFLSGGKQADTSIWINGQEKAPLNTATYWNTEVSLIRRDNTFNITAKDAAQNESIPAVANILFDNIPPTGTLKINNDAQYTNSKEVSLTITAQDNSGGSGVEKMQFSNDNIDWSSPLQNYTTSKSWTLPEGDGEKTVYVKFRDEAGNWSLSYSDSILLDITPPQLSITNPEDNTLTNLRLTAVLGTIDDNSVTVEVNGETADVSEGIFTMQDVSLLEGENTIHAVATDRAGNFASDSITINLDSIPPEIIITSPENGSYTNQLQITLEGTVDTQPFSEIRDLLKEGENILTKEARDEAGNASSSSVTVIRDTMPPVIQFIAPAKSAIINYTPIEVIWTADEVEYRDSKDLVEGINTITRSYTDQAGNNGTGSVNVTLDTHAPSLSINSPADDSFINQTSPQLIYSTDGVVTEILLDAQALVPIPESGDNLPQLTESQHTLTITCEDPATNQSTVQITFTVDTTPPVVVITSPEEGSSTNQTSIEIIYTVDGVEYKDIEQLIQEGENTVTRNFTDAAGNSGSNSIKVIRDTIAPVIEVVQPKDGAIINHTPIDVVYTVDGITQQDSENLSEGKNTITRSSTDSVGNTSSVSINVTLDTIPPAKPGLNPINSPTQQNTQTLSGTKQANTSLWINGQRSFGLNNFTTWATDVSLSEGENIFNITTKDKALNESTASQANIFLDTTGPNTPVVTDDGLYTSSATQLHASWVSSDPQTGIAEYQYAIGTTIGGTELVNWRQAGTQTEITHKGLSLTKSQIYYISVKAKNGAGIWSQVGCSDGITVNNNPPVISYVIPANGSGFYPNDIVVISASAFDPEEDSLKYQFSIDNQVKQVWSSSSTYNWTIFSSDTGLHTIKVEVTDDIGGLCSQSGEVYIFLSPIELPSM